MMKQKGFSTFEVGGENTLTNEEGIPPNDKKLTDSIVGDKLSGEPTISGLERHA